MGNNTLMHTATPKRHRYHQQPDVLPANTHRPMTWNETDSYDTRGRHVSTTDALESCMQEVRQPNAAAP